MEHVKSWRRFKISCSTEQQRDLERLIKEKGLNREDLFLIVDSLQFRDGVCREDLRRMYEARRNP